MKKIISLMLCLIMLVTLVPATMAEEPVSSRDRLTIAIVSDPGRLRSDTLYVLAAIPYNSLIYDTLLSQGVTGEIMPRVATEWTLDEDNLGVTIKLRDDVYFHDGAKMTSEDVLYSIIYGAQDTSYGSQLTHVDFDASKCIDENTIYFKFNTVNSLWYSPFMSLGIFEKAAYEAASSADEFYLDPMTSAPYVLKKWVSGDSLTFEAFPQYWEGEPKIKTIMLRVIPESAVAMMELQTGGVDVIFNMTLENYKSACNTPGVVGYDGQPSTTSVGLGFNCKNEALNNLKVRQALAYAIDLEAITEGAFDSAATVCHSSFGKNAFGYSEEAAANYPYEYNPEKAKELLAEAGYGEGDLTFRLIVDETPARNLFAEQLFNMFGEIGVTLDIQKYDYPTGTDIVGNQPDAYDMYIRGFANNSGEPVFMFTSSVGCKATHWDLDAMGAHYNELWANAQAEMDPEVRAEIYKTFQSEFNTDMMYWVPGVQMTLYSALNEKLTGIDWTGTYWRWTNAYFA